MQTIDGTPAQPPVYSLLIAADTAPEPARWQLDGVQWAPEQHGEGGAVEIACAGDSPDGKPLGTHPDINSAAPFAVYADDHCTSLGSVERDFESRARRQLAAVQSYLIAKEFQLGTLRDAAAGGTALSENVALVDAQDIAPGGTPLAALATLEQALADTFHGARTMIHVTAGTFVELAAGLAIYQPPGGQRWFSVGGSVIAMDAGYGPEGSDIFMYGTALVSVRLSDPVLTPPTIEQATDRATNDIEVRAERLALVVLDHSEADPGDLMFKVDTGLNWFASSS